MERSRFYIIGIGLVIAGVLGVQYWNDQSTSQARVTFLNVGQGDAIYIRTSAHNDVLMDGGPDDQVVRRLGEHMPVWDRTIELVVLSHTDADHITGIVELFRYYEISTIAIVDISVTSQTQEALYAAIAEQGTTIIHPLTGDHIPLSEREQLTILHPYVNENLEALERNDTGIVAEYTYNGTRTTRILLTGDISSTIEQSMVAAGYLSDVDILKVPHHGSKTSSSAELLSATQPEYAVIQVGSDNSYGHPHAEVVDRLESVATVLRNDTLGDIEFTVSDAGLHYLD